MNINTNSMMAHQDWMNSDANNIANVNTEGFKSTQTTIQNNLHQAYMERMGFVDIHFVGIL